MHPILFRIGNFTFYTYGLIMAIAFLIAYFYVLYLARISGQEVEFYSNLFFWVMVMGILGAKALFLIVSWKELMGNLQDITGCLRGGLVWYGGVIAVVPFAYYYCRRHKKDFAKIADTIVSPSLVGLGIGRWGCLMAGCCYGRETQLPWAIVYKAEQTVLQLFGENGVITWVTEKISHPTYPHSVHPAPVYESIGDFIIALICYEIFRRSKRSGITALIAFILYAIFRFLLEGTIRGDEDRGFVFGSFSTSQLISILIIVPSIYLLIRQLRKPLAKEEKPKLQNLKNKKSQR